MLRMVAEETPSPLSRARLCEDTGSPVTMCSRTSAASRRRDRSDRSWETIGLQKLTPNYIGCSPFSVLGPRFTGRVTLHFRPHHRWSSQYSVGSVPVRNDSVMVLGQPGSASLPVSRSISANEMPSGTSNVLLDWPAVALFMNCVQIGSAA